MRSRLGPAIQAGTLVTFVAGAALVLAPEHAGVIARFWLLGLALIGSITASGLVSGAPADPHRPPRPWRRQKRRAPVLPDELEALQLAIEVGLTSEFERHYRLRPVMVDTAAGLLLRRHDLDLERDQERVAGLLGPQLWELVRPDRPEPPGRGRIELERSELVAVVDSLEALAST